MLKNRNLPRDCRAAGNATGGWSRSTRAQWWLALFTLAVLMPGCGGCSSDPIDEEAKATAKEKLEAKKKEKAKPDFEPPKLSIIPQKTDVAAIRPVKPGHWTAAIEEMKANNFDFNGGQIFAEVRETGSGKVLDLQRTPHKLAIVRPATLPKGQTKFLEMMFFVPGNAPKAWLATELRSRGGSPVTSPGPEPLSILRAHQYNMVVLAAEGDRYQRLDSLDSIRAPHVDGPLNYYQVVAVKLAKPLPLPSNALAWTNIAYLVWDDVDPQLLSLEQQSAMIDWLHWGGQLIISGPKSLDGLRGTTFLGPYLPALAGEPLKISAQTLAPLSKKWTLPERGKPGRPLAPVNPWSGVALNLQGDARYVPGTADLVAERQVGRGRIVTTAFRLTQREFWNWPGCDGFWNACLLHRPPRRFSQAPDTGLGGMRVDFVGGSSSLLSSLLPKAWNEMLTADDSPQFLNPALISQVRYISRDWAKDQGFDSPFKTPPTVDETGFGNRWNAGNPAAGAMVDDQPMTLADDRPIGPGVAGWTDFSDIANGARDSLREAAGIVIPKAGFVIAVLVLYLVVLVPLNWLVFWGLGRVEWAWIAAPIIAIGGMAAVVKLAQLDIGFARSQTEVAVLETYNHYPRGHLTRYTALYTSLSTTYDLGSEDLNTVALPFSVDPLFEPLAGQTSDTVTYQSDPTVQLADFAVASNSTAMLHTEQMLDLGGAFEYSAQGDTGELTNKTKLDLTQAGIVRRKPDGQLQFGWIGDVGAGRPAKVTFVRTEAFRKVEPEWSFSLTEKSDKTEPQFSIDRLADLFKPSELVAVQKKPAQKKPDEKNAEQTNANAKDQGDETTAGGLNPAEKQPDESDKPSILALRPGETRLIALVKQPLPGITVDPAASQSGRGATLVITHLESPPLADPKPDANCRRDILTGREERQLQETIEENEPPDV